MQKTGLMIGCIIVSLIICTQVVAADVDESVISQLLISPSGGAGGSGSSAGGMVWPTPLPLMFIENIGQTADQVRFHVVSEGGSIFFTNEGPVVSVRNPEGG